jgi:hypothetical protein
MSFGFSMGDFAAVFQIVQKIYEQIRDAPEQYRAISNEYALPMILCPCLHNQ